MDKIDLRSLEEELANLDPEDLRYLSQLLVEDPPAVQKGNKECVGRTNPRSRKEKIKSPIKTKTLQTNTAAKKQKKKISKSI